MKSVAARIRSVQRHAPTPLRVFLAGIRAWSADDVSRLGASVAYYTLFALAPMLVVVVGLAGLFYGQDAVRGELVGQIQGLVGESGAELIESLLRKVVYGGGSTLAVIIGSTVFFLGAVGSFVELQSALNDIWRVKTNAGAGIMTFLIHRVRSFGMVMAIGFLLLVSLTLNTALAAGSAWVTTRLPDVPMLWQLVNQVVSFGVITVLFALIFMVLPDVQLKWRDVWTGAIATALLFSIGKYLIGIYLGQATFVSAYGAAGSVVLVLLWIFYSAQIVLLGAEITRIVVRSRGIRPRPVAYAKKKQTA